MINPQDINIEVIRLLRAGKYLEAIKYYKSQTGVSLKNAKESVDSIARKHNLKGVTNQTEKSVYWTRIFIGFIILNVILFIAFIISSSIINSLEYMDSLFGLSEWEVNELNANLSQKNYLIPLIIALEIFLFIFLMIKSIGAKVQTKSYIIFIIILLLIVVPISNFIKSDKNRFKNQEKMEVIFKELKDKRAFKDKVIEVSDLGFYVGNIDRQTSIYIVATFNKDRYTYRPYNLIMNWSKDNNQSSYIDSESILLDKLNVEKIVPKVFEASDKIIKEKNLTHRYKGVGRVHLLYTIVKGKYGWYWRSVIEERSNRSLSSEYVVFDLNGNLVDLPEVFQ